MRGKTSATIPVLILLLGLACTAHAGMTVYSLTDIARARLDALSFFFAAYLFICWMVKVVWNHLASTFTVMPRLDYRRALALVFVTGLLFYVVLTMISGARELLTPGAWEKQGTGYRLRDANATSLSKDVRHAHLLCLKQAIWEYALAHNGAGPPGPLADGIDRHLWLFEGGGFYCLVPHVKPGGGRNILVYEPATAGARRFVLLADGSIEDRTDGELKLQLARELK